MSREKQIEEMAKDLQETHDYEGCEAWHCGGCEYEKYGKNYLCSSIKQAEKMTDKGYRKQSEGEWEIKSEIYQMLDDVDEELYVECPFCKRRFWVPYEFDDKKIFEYAREHYPYCNCGAKMKGGAE